MSDIPPPADDQPTETVAETNETSSTRPTRIVGIILILTAAVLGWLLLVGYVAYQSGQQQLVTNQQTALADLIVRQTELAAQNLADGNYQLAQRRAEWVLEKQPQHEAAVQLLADIQTAQNQNATAVPQNVAPTPPPEPTATPGAISSPEEELQRIRRMAARKEWPESVSALVLFQQQFPSMAREETDALLFDAYLGTARQYLEGTQVELGLFYLEQAEKLGTLPQEMQDYRVWGELYTQGISFYGVNWDVSAYYFRDLCLAAPFYQDACAKLHNALVAYGDLFAGSLDWCPAQQLYEEARQHQSSEALSGKLNAAREGCLSATPTPDVISGTLPLTDTEQLPNFNAPTEPEEQP
jgi:hypothetical protein